MGVVTRISSEEYLRTSFRPDCDHVDGLVVERNVGKKKHSYTLGRTCLWFYSRQIELQAEPFVAQRIQVAPRRYRMPDIVVVSSPSPDEEVFTAPPYLCVEVMSPEDTMSGMQDRIDDYLRLGVPGIWVIDPWKRRAWTVSAQGWHSAVDGILCTEDGRVAMPLSEVLPPTD